MLISVLRKYFGIREFDRDCGVDHHCFTFDCLYGLYLNWESVGSVLDFVVNEYRRNYNNSWWSDGDLLETAGSLLLDYSKGINKKLDEAGGEVNEI
jgi:hypothetical protein